MKPDCTFNHINIGSCKLDQIGGRNIHWIEAGTGPGVVLIHGSQAWAYAWRHQIKPLAKVGYRAIALDMPGSGFSDLSSAAHYSISALSCFLDDLLAELKIPKAVFVASSAGGLPVLDLAIHYPERVAGLVLSSTCGVPHDLPVLWKLRRWPLIGELMGLFLNESIVRSNLQEAFYDQSIITDEMVSAYLAPLRRKRAWRTILKLERSWDPSSVEEQIHRIRCPVLVIWGENDPWHPASMAHKFGRRIKGTQVEILPACGHLPHEERPDIFNHLLVSFLSKNAFEMN